MYLVSKIFSMETEFRIPRKVHDLFLDYTVCLASFFQGGLISKIDLHMAWGFIIFWLNSSNLVICSPE